MSGSRNRNKDMSLVNNELVSLSQDVSDIHNPANLKDE